MLFKVNGILVQGLLHSQVINLILSKPDKVKLQVAPISSTSIRPGPSAAPKSSKKPNILTELTKQIQLSTSKWYNNLYQAASPIVKGRDPMAKEGSSPTPICCEDLPKCKRTGYSLFRRLSSKKVELLGSPCPSHHHKSGSASTEASLGPGKSLLPVARSEGHHEKKHTILRNHPLHLGRRCSSGSTTVDSTGNSPQSMSPSSSGSNSPSYQQMGRPSSLLFHHGMKLSSAGGGHGSGFMVHPSSRRKSWHNIPPSPLARTPSTSTTNANNAGAHSAATSKTSKSSAVRREGANAEQTLQTASERPVELALKTTAQWNGPYLPLGAWATSERSF